MGENLQRQAASEQYVSSAARIRDNQRRSRARHRDYVEEMKARIREYERRDAQATLDMRHAARAVALENSRLRSLLASHGITSDEVEMHLGSFHRHETPTSARAVGTGTGTGPAAVAPEHGQHQPDNASTASALDMLAILADASAQQTTCCGPTTQCAPESVREAPCRSGSTTPGRGPRPRTPGPETPTATASHLEMSCTAAARIITSISYRDGNDESARQVLGCSGPEECFVKNTVLFQFLDTSP